MLTTTELELLFDGTVPRHNTLDGRLNYYDLYRDGVTQGILNKWLTCRESARLGVIYGLAGQRNMFPMEFGNVFHEALEYTYGYYRDHRNLTLPEILIACVKGMHAAQDRDIIHAMEMTGSVKRIEAIEYTYKLAEVVARRYFRAWHTDFAEIKWVGLEQEFEYHLPAKYEIKFPLRGKMDGVFMDASGNLQLFETKTKSVINNDAVKLNLPMNMQVGLYSLVVGEMYGNEPIGVTYNMVKRPGLRKKQTESEDQFIQRCASDIDNLTNDYFTRYEVSTTPRERATFQAELIEILYEFEEWYRAVRMENPVGYKGHYRNANACSVGPFTCEYLEACSLGAYDQLGKKDFIYPELPLYQKRSLEELSDKQ